MAQFLENNQIQLLHNGVEYFSALETAINNAKFEVHIETYIYRADRTGTRIGEFLIEAAQRGVMICLLLDGFGCKDLSKNFVKNLEQAGVKIIFYRPKISAWSLKKNRLRRLHRKVAVIDRSIGFVGGINIMDDVDSHQQNSLFPRVDYAVRIQGDLIPSVTESVRKLWQRLAWIHLRATKFDFAITPAEPLSPSNHTKAAFILRDNVLHRRDIENAYLEAINNAKSEIIIANAYFVPGRRFRRALLEASKRGVTVKLLLQGNKEYFLMFATHAFYSEFLRNQIEIYEYRKSFMHSKVAVIDQYWATVGSSNIDPFSLLLAREANILVLDSTFSNELRADIILSINTGAHRVLPQEWEQGNIAKRFISWMTYGFVRLFLGLIGHASE